MKRITLTLLCVVMLAAIFAGETLPRDDADTGQVIPLPEQRLPEYERLTYKIKWLGLPVGTILASIKGIEKIRGRDAYVL